VYVLCRSLSAPDSDSFVAPAARGARNAVLTSERAMTSIIALAMLVGGAIWWRASYLRRAAASSPERRQLASTGIVIGAESFTLERPHAPAVLLLHGAGDTPQTLRYLAASLHSRGFHVSAPLLPGHGRSIADFARIRADQLIAAARENLRNLRADHSWVGVIGLSMGGALAVQIAAESPDLPALGLVAPYLTMPRDIDRAARLAWLWGIVVPVVRSANGISVLDPEERERSLGYGVFTAAGLRALRTTARRGFAALPRVAAPTLMIQSREDNRISVADAERVFARLGAKEKRLQWITGAAHVITVDYGRDVVIASLASWMESHGVSS
jgi:carboxylesterase